MKIVYDRIPNDYEDNTFYILPGASFLNFVALWVLEITPEIEYRSPGTKDKPLAAGYAYDRKHQKQIEENADKYKSWA